MISCLEGTETFKDSRKFIPQSYQLVQNSVFHTNNSLHCANFHCTRETAFISEIFLAVLDSLGQGPGELL